MRRPLLPSNSQPCYRPQSSPTVARLSSEMRAKISQFESFDDPSPDDWRAVQLRAKQCEQEHRRAVVAARRSLHMDVHVGGGEDFIVIRQLVINQTFMSVSIHGCSLNYISSTISCYFI